MHKIGIDAVLDKYGYVRYSALTIVKSRYCICHEA